MGLEIYYSVLSGYIHSEYAFRCQLRPQERRWMVCYQFSNEFETATHRPSFKLVGIAGSALRSSFSRHFTFAVYIRRGQQLVQKFYGY